MARSILKETVEVKMALRGEVDRSVVRLPEIVRKAIGVELRDKVTVQSKRAQVIRTVIRALEQEIGEKIVGIGKADRETLGVEVGDTVQVFKTPQKDIEDQQEPERTIWLFCYGSNNPKQLGERLGRKIKGVAAYLPGYHRVFRGFSRIWEGGVASLIKVDEPDAAIYGYATLISVDELLKLDLYEGTSLGAYTRKTLRIVLAKGPEERFTEATLYIATATNFHAPTPEYLKAVVKTISPFWREGDRAVRVSDIPIRRNPDEELRALERRWRTTGDWNDKLAWNASMVRAGRIPPPDVEVHFLWDDHQILRGITGDGLTYPTEWEPQSGTPNQIYRRWYFPNNKGVSTFYWQEEPLPWRSPLILSVPLARHEMQCALFTYNSNEKTSLDANYLDDVLVKGPRIVLAWPLGNAPDPDPEWTQETILVSDQDSLLHFLQRASTDSFSDNDS